MAIGKIAVEAIREWDPFSPANVGRRKTNRAIRKILRKLSKGKPLSAAEEKFMAENTATVTLPDGTVVQRPEPTIPGRTSTKIAAGAGVLGAFPAVEILQWVQSIEFGVPWIETVTNSDYFIYYGTVLIAWLIARFSRSPAKPGAL